MKYICDHKTDACKYCEHAVPHEPIDINSWPESCEKKGGVCQWVSALVQCVQVDSHKRW